MHATIPKGVVGGFKFTFLQRTLKEWHERPWTYVCDCKRKATKVGLTAKQCQEQCIDHVPSGLSRAYFFFQHPFEIAVYVAVQFYPWFKFYFPLFQTTYHTLPYPKTKENKI